MNISISYQLFTIYLNFFIFLLLFVNSHLCNYKLLLCDIISIGIFYIVHVSLYDDWFNCIYLYHLYEYYELVLYKILIIIFMNKCFEMKWDKAEFWKMDIEQFNFYSKMYVQSKSKWPAGICDTQYSCVIGLFCLMLLNLHIKKACCLRYPLNI